MNIPAFLEKPEATTYPIEDLMAFARKGRFRIPDFQRLFKWTDKHIRELFDSIYRGYPIGSLLLWEKKGKSEPLVFGDFKVLANEDSRAWFIVDGQQRIISLVGVLLAPEEAEHSDPRFTFYFDLKADTFVHAEPEKKSVPPHWFPLRIIGDTLKLRAWQRQYSGPEEDILRSDIVAKTIREYRVPVYIVRKEDERVLWKVFDRLNGGGVPLKAHEIFKAYRADEPLENLGKAFQDTGFGKPDEDVIIKLILGIRGLDITRDFKPQLREESVAGTVEDLLKVIPALIQFLREDAHIPHYELLPYRPPLAILARFFHLYPNPTPQSRVTLARWLWRGASCSLYQGRYVTRARSSVKDMPEADETSAVSHLWKEVENRTFPDAQLDRYDFRSAQSKLGCLALLSLRPRSILTGQPIEITPALDSRGHEAFASVIRRSAHLEDEPMMRSLANRLVQPLERGEVALQLLRKLSPQSEAAASLGIPAEALQSLQRHDEVGFLRIRREFLLSYLGKFLREKGYW